MDGLRSHVQLAFFSIDQIPVAFDLPDNQLNRIPGTAAQLLQLGKILGHMGHLHETLGCARTVQQIVEEKLLQHLLALLLTDVPDHEQDGVRVGRLPCGHGMDGQLMAMGGLPIGGRGQEAFPVNGLSCLLDLQNRHIGAANGTIGSGAAAARCFAGMDAAEHLAGAAAQPFMKRHDAQHLKQTIIGINDLPLFVENQHKVGENVKKLLDGAVPG
ncbi:hypothetical protein D3C75_854450 [compost metagenome]